MSNSNGNYYHYFFFSIFQASNQVNFLSDLILDDILVDTAKEMERIEYRADIAKQAKLMQVVPTVEGLLQTLDIMEVFI